LVAGGVAGVLGELFRAGIEHQREIEKRQAERDREREDERDGGWER
jgi:hypothetical protein